MTPFISFKNFTFKYDSQIEPTLKNINLDIQKGQKVLILGASGSGKSTLAQCINGIIPNRYHGEKTGDLFIDDKDAFDLSIYDKSLLVSTVLQDTDGQFIGLTVAEDLAFALENDAVEKKDMITKVHKWSDTLELNSLLEKRPQDLSGGQKQRVSLGGVLIDESPILLFDEPLANLDPKSGQETIDLIDKIHKREKTTTIIIEHRLEDVLYRDVDLVVLVDDGEIVFSGNVGELLKTKLLEENGIREPLYINILKKLNVNLEKIENIENVHNINFNEELSTLQKKIDELQLGTETKIEKELEKNDSNITTPDVLSSLKVEQLEFSYDDVNKILKNISFDMKKGEKIAIVGKNGAGKSTLAKAICKFIETKGNIFVHGELSNGDTIKQRGEKIGYILQNPNQMISKDMIFDEVALGLRLRGIDEKEVETRVYETLKICGLYQFRKWPISALSFGQKKRVTIASILVLQPNVILLDEPTAGQDKKHYTEMIDFLNELSDRGHTIIMITHDMQLMLEYADRSIVISDGKVIFDGSPNHLFVKADILQKANLKTTSLFDLANRLKLNPFDLTKYYIDSEKTEKVKKIHEIEVMKESKEVQLNENMKEIKEIEKGGKHV